MKITANDRPKFPLDSPYMGCTIFRIPRNRGGRWVMVEFLSFNSPRRIIGKAVGTNSCTGDPETRVIIVSNGGDLNKTFESFNILQENGSGNDG